ncbi:heavy metal translocating P-type ATPase metal-binding domain-containing protein [Belliella sp. R4-6]|uniref:Heavy metal translocating P-type ATPase metal-binding domain-containing protein n=1 Tax=Belliella alkalica TaxID=1730871 RepID=A0ABS9VH95_9BACT|nr:heavy metal translocating P-type ATPase metal-binding domain-containing protein [Belliella alkalica]MCH7415819.1 heavy metal translocating P-type ATPase metal-binding domain-containing protein [Belliella alkalica]
MGKVSKIYTPIAKANCYHCGESCVDEVLHFDEKEFCCSGCKLVYEVLNENDLCAYYEIAEAPGTSLGNSKAKDNRFDYLDDQEIIDRLIDFQNDSEVHITFTIPLIHCASCIWLLENLQKLHSGVVSGRVDFIKKKVQVKYSKGQISLKELVQLLSRIGYEPSLNLADIDKKNALPTNRKLIFKLAVAGFCFGNMMLFSLPEYFAEAELLGQGFKKTFNYLNVLLSLPVFFYVATDYYKSAWLSLKNTAVNMDVPIALGIVTLFFYSLYDIFFLGNEGYMDTLGGLLFFLLIGKYYQQKTYDTLSFDRDYKSYFPVAVTKLVKNEEEVIPLIKLKVGDIIRVRNEELIPADSILLDGDAYIDYSFVTGEEVPVAKKQGELIYSGGRQKGTVLTLTVQKSPSQGYLTDLWNNESFEKEKVNSLENLANKVSGKFTMVVLLIAISALIYWVLQGQVSLGVLTFTSVLIITCPCALAMSTPFTLGNTLRVFGKGKFYLKNSQTIEKIAKVDTVIFDKTGTLTDPNKAKVKYIGELLSDESKQIIKAMVMHSTHALSNRINSYLDKITPVQLQSIDETQGKGLVCQYKSQEFRLGSMEFVGASSNGLPEGGNLVFFAVEDYVLGYFFIQSGLREGIQNVVSEVRQERAVHLLSGDQDHERVNLNNIFGEGISMNFNQGPSDKLAYIKRLNNKGANTMMVGDGLNDAGALRESHVGIAVTDKVTNFSPASDAIMDASVISKLPAFLDFAKTSRSIIKASFGLSFTYNAVGVYFAVQGLVSPVFCAILMPISSISVVIFTTITTNYLAYKRGLKDKIW